MPHLLLEYTASLAGAFDPALLGRLHTALEDAGFAPSNCKSRAVKREVWCTGAGAPGPASAPFVHLDVRVLEGRDPAVLRGLGERLLAELRSGFGDAASGAQITVSIGEFRRAGYFKWPPGTLPGPSGGEAARG